MVVGETVAETIWVFMMVEGRGVMKQEQALLISDDAKAAIQYGMWTGAGFLFFNTNVVYTVSVLFATWSILFVHKKSQWGLKLKLTLWKWGSVPALWMLWLLLW